MKKNRLLSQISGRSRNIIKHIGWSFIFKIGSVLASFMLVPISINYLGKESYGIWLTLSSVISWFALCDIGMGNGLRNKFAEAKACGKNYDAHAFVSTAYFTIGIISLMLVGILISLGLFVEWGQVFNASQYLGSELSFLLPVVFGFFGLQLVTKLIVSIYQADQNHSIQDKVQFFSQMLSLVMIWLLSKTGGGSLFVFGSLYAALPVLVLLALNFFAFKGKYRVYRPVFRMVKREHLTAISGLGFKFFILQIAAVVLFSTDNYIITQLFGPAEVVSYNVAFKYFSIVTMGFSMLITPYWSSFTVAYAKQEFDWIKGSVSRVQKIWTIIPVVLLMMVLFSDYFYLQWVGNDITVPISLSISMAVYAAIMSFHITYVYFINGVGKIQIQFIVAIVVIIANIPLSIYLGKYMDLGSTGVIIATSLCLSLYAIIFPIQYMKLINRSATGLWNK